LTRRRTSAVSGVTSEGFITTVQPTASAGATFHALNLANENGAELSNIVLHTTFGWDSSMGFCQKKILVTVDLALHSLTDICPQTPIGSGCVIAILDLRSISML
jgi:hypothetical protein